MGCILSHWHQWVTKGGEDMWYLWYKDPRARGSFAMATTQIPEIGRDHQSFDDDHVRWYKTLVQRCSKCGDFREHQVWESNESVKERKRRAKEYRFAAYR